MLKQIAVLLTCHNRKDKTVTCLHALYNNVVPENISFDVFLVDDGCSDGTVNAIKTHFPQTKIITGDGNLYWNRGMHLAWKTALQEKNYDYFLWLNDDTYLFQNALETILSSANLTDNKAIIIAATCSKKTGKLTYSGLTLNEEIIVPGDELKQVKIFSGNCVLIPLFVYQKVGNLDPLFHHALGDNDYSFRAFKKGIKSFVAPNFLAYCESHDTLPKWCLSSIPLKERALSLYSPKGHCQPYMFFRYELRHFGLLTALKHFVSINLRMLIPSLWNL